MTNTTQADVQLVLMPYASISRPSIALGLLKTALVRAGIPTKVRYANLAFVGEIGLHALTIVQHDRVDLSLGEWTFAQAAFPDRATSASTMVDLVKNISTKHTFSEKFPEEFQEALHRIREEATRFVAEEADRILSENPRIVGCSSMFEQHTASLAILRRIKHLAPDVTTMIGGANCESEMGWATIRAFPWVDYVISGEADEIIAPLCRTILEKGPDNPLDHVPHGVLTRAHVTSERFGAGKAPPPRAIVHDLDALSTPDYSEYFEMLERSPLSQRIKPGLVAETSRGCWWGEVSHCTFCGLNGEGMTYRRKSPERVMREFTDLSNTWNVRNVEVVDNIIDNRYLKSLLPTLESEGAPFNLFYETKSNLKREHVKQMAASGINWIQPGIESLHDDLLKLMGKGCTALTNVQLLKYSREFGIRVIWSLLVDFPLEEDTWHEEVAAWLPRISHLEGPSGCIAVRFDRFSPYHQSPEKYGLDLVPNPSYSAVYPVTDDLLKEMGYFFIDRNKTSPSRDRIGIRKLITATSKWLGDFRKNVRPVLSMLDRGDSIDIFDTRACASKRRRSLVGLEAEIYRICDPACLETTVAKRVFDAVGKRHSEREIRDAMESLDESQLILRINGRILSLAVSGKIPTLPFRPEFPGGWNENPPVNEITIRTALEELRNSAEHARLRPLRSAESSATT